MLIKETTRERAENDTTILVPVHDLVLPQGRICRLYVGNLTGASDGAALLAAGITSSLNVSLNIDVAPLQLSDGTHMRRAKVGLIDGAGNTPAHLAAAVLALEGLVTQTSPGKPNYPAHRAGHVLVNCRGGRSRSVIVLAIYLHLRAPGTFPTLDSAVSHIRRARGNSDTYPLPPMLDLARAVLASGSLPALLQG
ncbi:protein phosphatase [Paracoccus sp. MA]|uniref:protein phosphatase n=1 Tax=unclassified Paracoccus (in: a-proteobacteria) TaxID=2688777 RepID=UPI00048A9283|nr:MULTISPECIES: protein phosphatase [unclassified Paracoccus (in: a-proteobacteria)]RQP07425.1 MAG: protein phosphatase [Paracoccus sp. BP8]UFM64049.1 protein phosphatase [Paracoccus sp. MA]